MQYKLILMYADDTLLDFEAAEEKALSMLFDRYSLPSEAKIDYRRINSACWAAFERGEMTQTELRKKRFVDFCSCRLPDEDPSCAAAFYEHALSLQSITLDGALYAVKEISEKLPIAIVTNGIATIQRPRITSSPIYPHISSLLISEETGFQKPDPGMLLMALEKYAVSPCEALMIGDSLSSDMQAAKQAGIDFLWYNPKGKARTSDAVIRYETKNIMDFVRISLS